MICNDGRLRLRSGYNQSTRSNDNNNNNYIFKKLIITMGENNINNNRNQCHAIMAENQNNVTRKTIERNDI